MNLFSKYLTLWVALCIGIGVTLGKLMPGAVDYLETFTYAQISIPIVILIWVMIYPMMLKIDFTSIKDASKNPKGLVVTTVVNWLVKPFTMYLIAYFFFFVVFKSLIPETAAQEYLIGAVLLGAAPCTAMVFVWSHLVKGSSAYTAIQVALNDFILLFAFTPIVALLLGISDIQIPYDTLFLSVLLFVVIPIIVAYITRRVISNNNKISLDVFIGKFNGIPEVGLLLTLVLIFMFQGDVILNNPLDILLISVPLIIQTIFIFFVAYIWSKVWKMKHDVAAPGALIGASNFFELAVAVSIALFGLNSGATLATVVGVLVEVPLMLFLVSIAKKTTNWFKF
ncbi:ACR3 family arsenite efflux transporter [Mycoplasmatota bacterium WC44]